MKSGQVEVAPADSAFVNETKESDLDTTTFFDSFLSRVVQRPVVLALFSIVAVV